MRVYLTLHQMGKCCDKMIDGSLADYGELWQKLDAGGAYRTTDEFTLGMLYDEQNPSSVISAQKYAMDNAILLREDIMSETLSYLEMSVALLRKLKEQGETNVTAMQPIKDWSLAFWGSAEQRIQNHRALDIMMMGRNIENIDMLLRFGYSYRRLALAMESLGRYTADMSVDGLEGMLDNQIKAQIDDLLTEEKYDLKDDEYKFKLIKYVNQLVRV